jgi:hypothetical protein
VHQRGAAQERDGVERLERELGHRREG